MKKISIGIPRAFNYYKYGVLWKTFFERIGLKVILSPKTNQQIIKLGTTNTQRLSCWSYKIYLGHALYLKDKCDYVFIPQICNYGKNAKVCQYHFIAYENIKKFISTKEILTYRMDHTSHRYQLFELCKIAFRFTKNPIKIIYSLKLALKKQKNYNISKENENKNKLTKINKKVLIVSPIYNLNDEYIIKPIINYFENNNIISIIATHLDKKIATDFSLYYQYLIPWKDYQELLGAIYYYQYQVDGIVFLFSEECEIFNIFKDTTTLKKPLLFISPENIKVDSQIDAFIDIIKSKEKEF